MKNMKFFMFVVVSDIKIKPEAVDDFKKSMRLKW